MGKKRIRLIDLLLVLVLFSAAVSLFFTGKQTTYIDPANLIPRPYFYSKHWVTVEMEARAVPTILDMVQEGDLDIDGEKNIVMGEIVKIVDRASAMRDNYRPRDFNNAKLYGYVTVIARIRAFKHDDQYVVKRDLQLRAGEKYIFENKDYILSFLVTKIIKDEKIPE